MNIDDAVVQQTSVVRFPKLLAAEELDLVRRCQRAQLESGIRPQQHPHKRRTFLSGGGAAGGGLRGWAPGVVEKLVGAAVQAKALGGWGEKTGGALTDSDLMGLEVRVAEFWEYEPGGGLVDDYHYDTGSTVTVVCLVNEHTDFTGGTFRTFEPDRTHAEHRLEQGDAVCFLSHKYHNITPVASGHRHTLVLELWKGYDPGCASECSPRMASDQELGFVSCTDCRAARQAIRNCEKRLEFMGIRSREELSACLDFVEEVLASASAHAGQTLAGLSFTSCSMNTEDFDRLGRTFHLDAGTKLEDIGISKCPGITRELWSRFWTRIPKGVRWLDFGDNQFTDDCVASLFGSLLGFPGLEKLHLDGNKMVDVTQLCKALQGGSRISDLDLGDNCITDAGALSLSTALAGATVSTLVLGINTIGAWGARELFNALPGSCVRVLYLDHTGVDDSCLEVLSKVLGDSKLEELHIDSTKITERGAQSLIQALARSKLAFLDIGDNGLCEHTVRRLEEALPDQSGGSSMSD